MKRLNTDKGMGELRDAAYRLSFEGHLQGRRLTMEDARAMMLPGHLGDGAPINDDFPARYAEVM